MSHIKVTITLNIYDIVDNPLKGDFVKVKMNVKHAWYGNDLIKQQEEIFYANSNGLVNMELIETETLTSDTFPESGDDNEVYYEVNVGNKFFTKIRVPKSPTTTNFKDLPQI